MKRTVLATAAVLLLAGCGSGSEGTEAAEPSASASSEAPEPEMLEVRVGLVDSPPQELLYNGDDGVCTSVELFAGQAAGQPTVTLRDAAGDIVGVKDLNSEGGIFDQEFGCDWFVTFNVAQSDFYEATVEHQGVEYSGSGSATGGRQILIEF